MVRRFDDECARCCEPAEQLFNGVDGDKTVASTPAANQPAKQTTL